MLRKRVVARERREGVGVQGLHACSYKEGKAFSSTFGDLTSHYPITSLGNKRGRSSTGQRSSVHTTRRVLSCYYFEFLKFRPSYFSWRPPSWSPGVCTDTQRILPLSQMLQTLLRIDRVKRVLDVLAGVIYT